MEGHHESEGELTLKTRTSRRLVCAAAITLLMGMRLFAQTTVTSTQQDQKDLAVTVYNSNVALVTCAGCGSRSLRTSRTSATLEL